MVGLMRFEVGSGDVGGGVALRRDRFIFTLESLPYAVNCGLMRNRAQCQPHDRLRPKGKKSYRPSLTYGLDHLRRRSDGDEHMRSGRHQHMGSPLSL
jgi:hypothetical protein